jgi:hypothetical protein
MACKPPLTTKRSVNDENVLGSLISYLDGIIFLPFIHIENELPLYSQGGND